MIKCNPIGIDIEIMAFIGEY